MENNSGITQSLKDIKKVAKNTSWFRDTPHRWATASLPLAYAVACVEMVSKSSEKASVLYQRIIEAWGDPGIKAVFDEIASIVPESEKEKVKNALLHPETELLQDPNKPFKQLEEMFTGLEINEDIFKDDDNTISAFDIQNIGTHEAGHVVGLADLYEEKYNMLTMYGYSDIGETQKCSLESGDRLGAQKLYGVAP